MTCGKPFTSIARSSCILRMLVLVCLASLTVGSWAAAAEQPRPNILFIMSDDHGYQAVSCYPGAINQTPHLDRLAKEGMRLDRAYVTNSLCGPSRACVLTGKYSHLNGFAKNGDRFDGSQQTVAKLLQQGGYQTAVIGKWHLESDPTGFDYWNILIGQGTYYDPVMKTATGKTKHQGYTTELITDDALAWLGKRDAKKPFFLMLHHKAPHRNWQSAPQYLSKYQDQKIPEPTSLLDDYSGRGRPAHEQEMTIARHLNPHDLKLAPQGGLTPDEQKKFDAAYGAENEAYRKANLQGDEATRWKYQRFAKDYLRCIDSVDENVGRVLDYLDKSGLAQNTLVVYTSDNGWYLGEHGWFDKRWMYEESFRVPLMVRWPGVTKPGSTSASFAMNLDFAETFLDAAGLAIPADMQGLSLRPVLAGSPPADWRKSIYYHYYELAEHRVQPHYGVRTDRYKLIYFNRLNEWEMYDLEKDPHEMKSVYAEPSYAEATSQLKTELAHLREKYQDLRDDKPPPAKNAPTK